MSYRALKIALVVFVLAIVWWRVSENTVDPDLWGHVLYGQRMAAQGGVERSDPFSWTAVGAPWINHEIGAEWVMGQVHQWAGGPGLFGLMVVLGLTVFLGAVLGGGGYRLNGVGIWAWALGLLASRDIAYGFAMRPQVFSAAFLLLLLLLLKALQSGRRLSLVAIPALLILWINVHGGVSAAVGLLVVALVAALAQGPLAGAAGLAALGLKPARRGFVWALAFVVVAGIAGLFLNPYGARLPLWLLKSLTYMRPEIVEWRPIGISVERLPYLALVGLMLAGWWLSRREKHLWEPAVCLFLAVAAAFHQRHLPLFAISVCVLMPAHVADAAVRLKGFYANLADRFESGGVRAVVALALLVGAGLALWGSGRGGKERIGTMEIPRNMYPVEAIAFMKAAGLEGNLLNYFDWGQQLIWEFPDSRVSFDGRLDTVYSRALIEAHWRFYRGEPGWETLLEVGRADVALLPTGAGGMELLMRRYGWKHVYQDPYASILVAAPTNYPALPAVQPVIRGEEALMGRVPFPDRPSAAVGIASK